MTPIANAKMQTRWIVGGVLLALTLLCFYIFFPTTTKPTLASTTGQETFTQSSSQLISWKRDGADWPRILGPTGNLLSTEKDFLSDWPENPPIVWTLPTGVGYGNGVAAEGRFFQFDRFGNQERVTCYAAETGTELWKWEAPVEYSDMYNYNNGPRCSPVVDQDQVVCYGVSGRLSCLHAPTGKLQWSVDTNERYGVIQNFFGVSSNPLFYKNLVIAMVGGSPEDSKNVPPGQLTLVKPNGSGMVAFDRNTGKEVYRTGNYLASYSAPILADIDGKTWCLALMREGLFVFDPDTGKEADFFAWRAKSNESVNAASPVVLGNEIFVSETYEIGSVRLRFENQKLTELWKDPARQRDQLMRAHWATPVAHGQYLFGSSGRNEPDSDLRCVDWKNEKVMWAVRTHQRANLLKIEDYFVVVLEHGQVLLMKNNPEKFEKVALYDFELITDPKTGRPLLESPVWAPPVYSHGYLYLRGAHTLVCLDLRKQVAK